MEQLWEEVKEYVDLRLRAFKLKAAEQLSVSTGRFLSIIAFVVLIGFALLLFSFALTLVVARWIDSLPWAFVIVGGLWTILALLCIFLRDAIFSSAMVKTFTKMFFPEKQEEEDEDDE